MENTNHIIQKNFLWYVFFVLFLMADQLSKIIFNEKEFSLGFIHFNSVKNYGLSFNMDFGSPWNLILSILIYLVAGMLVLSVQSQNTLVRVGKAMFLAGAAANLADRLIFGYVRDFLDIGLGFVFNFADVFIVLGVLFVLLSNRKTSKPQPVSQT